MSDASAIRLRGVAKRYGSIIAVNGLDLEVPVGTCVGLQPEAPRATRRT